MGRLMVRATATLRMCEKEAASGGNTWHLSRLYFFLLPFFIASAIELTNVNFIQWQLLPVNFSNFGSWICCYCCLSVTF